MVDIHSHILPMLDDGAYDFEESLIMAEMAARSGVKILVATPHSNQEGRFENYYTKELEYAFRALRDTIKDEHIPLELRLGMEIMSSNQMAKRLETGRLIGLNHSRYCLVEFWFDDYPDVMMEQLNSVLKTGRVPVLAHPERYECIKENPMLVRDFLKMGCKTQVNKGSILGRFGRHVENTAWTLLDYHLVTCIGSDAHTSYARTTEMREIKNCISRYFSPDDAYELLDKNPRMLIGENKYI